MDDNKEFPAFRDLDEADRWLATHSAADLTGWERPTEEGFVNVTVRLTREQYETLRNLAQEIGLGHTTFARTLVLDGMKRHRTRSPVIQAGGAEATGPMQVVRARRTMRAADANSAGAQRGNRTREGPADPGGAAVHRSNAPGSARPSVRTGHPGVKP